MPLFLSHEDLLLSWFAFPCCCWFSSLKWPNSGQSTSRARQRIHQDKLRQVVIPLTRAMPSIWTSFSVTVSGEWLAVPARRAESDEIESCCTLWWDCESLQIDDRETSTNRTGRGKKKSIIQGSFLFAAHTGRGPSIGGHSTHDVSCWVPTHWTCFAYEYSINGESVFRRVLPMNIQSTEGALVDVFCLQMFNQWREHLWTSMAWPLGMIKGQKVINSNESLPPAIPSIIIAASAHALHEILPSDTCCRRVSILENDSPLIFSRSSSLLGLSLSSK